MISVAYDFLCIFKNQLFHFCQVVYYDQTFAFSIDLFCFNIIQLKRHKYYHFEIIFESYRNLRVRCHFS